MQKKRYASVAMLLHLFTPGLGFLYSGKIWAAISVPLFFCIIVFSLGWSRNILEPWGIAALWASLFFIYLILLPLVFYTARKNAVTAHKRSHRWFIYAIFSTLVLLLLAGILHSRSVLFGYETFRLPSRSMANTLLPNDFIIVDKWIYKDYEPKRGDIVVFKLPSHASNGNHAKKPGTYYTKRIIALPGETISMREGKVFINSVQLSEPYVLLENNRKSIKRLFPEQQVPGKKYFMLGDNRDHSNDSRSWGFLNADAIYGKVISIWFSFSSTEGVRINRIKSVVLKAE